MYATSYFTSASVPPIVIIPVLLDTDAFTESSDTLIVVFVTVIVEFSASIDNFSAAQPSTAVLSTLFTTELSIVTFVFAAATLTVFRPVKSEFSISIVDPAADAATFTAQFAAFAVTSIIDTVDAPWITLIALSPDASIVYFLMEIYERV